ncbi:hypothetical protein SMALB_5841 [Streptomyces malaysiensis]|uniref:Uncharacterized protein n=1 Tax=Streptomyces malaysiensis TaxID=92644 RepID=A0A7X5X6Y9_STRMQ|nr:hypothetical protein [Streptomyces malaysiensis]
MRDRPASLLAPDSSVLLARLSRCVALACARPRKTPAAALRDPESVLQRFDQTVREVAELLGIRPPVAEQQAGVADEFGAHLELDRFHFVGRPRQIPCTVRIRHQVARFPGRSGPWQQPRLCAHLTTTIPCGAHTSSTRGTFSRRRSCRRSDP